MKTFEQWWSDIGWHFDCGDQVPHQESIEAAWNACAAGYEHRIANIEQSKNMRIKMLERQLKEAEDVIAFYAKAESYNHFPATSHPDCMDYVGFIIEGEPGDRAREYQKKYEVKSIQPKEAE